MKKKLRVESFTLFRFSAGVIILGNKLRKAISFKDPVRKVAGYKFRLLPIGGNGGGVAKVLVTSNTSQQRVLFIKWGQQSKFATPNKVLTFKKRRKRKSPKKNPPHPISRVLHNEPKEIDFFGPMGTENNGRDYTSPPP